MESKNYSWAWVTGDRLLSHGPCELIKAQLTATGGNADVTLYNGESTAEEILFTLKTLQNVSQQADLPNPAYCGKGLYVDIGSNVLGLFVMWKEL